MIAFGWCISALCLLPLPIWALFEIFKQKEGTWSEKIIKAFKPNSEWGPKDDVKSKISFTKI